jgi:hypothetical protein
LKYRTDQSPVGHQFNLEIRWGASLVMGSSPMVDKNWYSLNWLKPLRWGGVHPHASLFPHQVILSRYPFHVAEPFCGVVPKQRWQNRRCVFRLSWFLDPGERGLGEVVQPLVDLLTAAPWHPRKRVTRQLSHVSIYTP